MRVRTGYSFRQAVGTVDSVIARLTAIGYPVAPISDRASTFGFVKFTKAAKKAGLRPIYGVELGVTDMVKAKRPIVDYWTFFAKKDLRAINDLVELATTQFHREPLITYEQALAAKGVIKIAGSRAQLDKMKKQRDLYVGLSPSCARGYIHEATKRGYKLIAMSDNRFPTIEDAPLYELIAGRNAQRQTYPQHILSKEEWDVAVAFGFDDAWENMLKAMEQCKAELQSANLIRPHRPMTLREMCERGAKKLHVDLADPVYAARLEKELALIKHKNFEDYFYIIAEMVQWARPRMWVGPARGSSCGSLVCYLTEITTIDPLKYGLIFERFIDINRDDLPDVDIDFSDQHREEVFEHMRITYGEEHVARLGTVALYMPKSAIGEAAMALDVPFWMAKKVLDSLIERSSGDSRALQSLEDTLATTAAGKDLLKSNPEIAIAAKMEGHPRHSSRHAAGIILAEHPVKNYVAIDQRTGTTQCDKKDAEALNFLKIDALGLTQGAIFEDALKLAGLPPRHLESIPLDDPAAFDVINRSHYSGVFQFNGSALQSVCKQFVVDHIDDIISVTALARPGPLASGGTARWTARKAGKEEVAYWHPVFAPYLKDTLGVVVYQEQVMEIGRNIGDLSWEDVTALRKAMSKSLGKEFFDQYGDRWKKGALEKGVPREVADRVWDYMCAYGSWAFNKSHAVAYGHISYQCCWLKAHYPFEFAAATLSHEGDYIKQVKLLRELSQEGIKYIPVDINLSTDRWTTTMRDGERYLVGPLTLVKGVGPKYQDAILRLRALEGINGESLRLFEHGTLSVDPKTEKHVRRLAQRALSVVGDSPKTQIDSLWPITDAVDAICSDLREIGVTTIPTPISDIIKPCEEDREYVVICVPSVIAPRDENEPRLIQRRVAKGRPAIMTGPTDSLILRLTDDSEEMPAMIDRWKFPKVGKPIIDRGRPGKAIYVMKGKVRGGSDLRLLMIDRIKYLGDLERPVRSTDGHPQKPYDGTGEGVGIAPPATPEGKVIY